MFRNDIDAAIERARIAEDQLRRLEAKDEKNQAELDALRAVFETQRAEIARLRELAPAPAGAPPRSSRVPLIFFVLLPMLVLGGVGFFLVVRTADPAPPTPVRASMPAAVPVPRPLPRSDDSPALGEEIGDAAMTTLLTAHRWRADALGGVLRFAHRGDKLEGRLTVAAGSEQPVVVALGRLATLTLRLSREVDGMSERLTLHGAIGADRKTIRGTMDRVLTEGANQHSEQGVFTLTEVR